MKKTISILMAALLLLTLSVTAFAEVRTGDQTANSAGKYRVIVVEEDGTPIKGAVVQFCSDTACMLGKTDANGVAVFETEKGVYTVHMLKVPEGYEKNSEEVLTSATYSDTYYVLNRAA